MGDDPPAGRWKGEQACVALPVTVRVTITALPILYCVEEAAVSRARSRSGALALAPALPLCVSTFFLSLPLFLSSPLPLSLYSSRSQRQADQRRKTITSTISNAPKNLPKTTHTDTRDACLSISHEG